jgi:hypothetical protein
LAGIQNSAGPEAAHLRRDEASFVKAACGRAKLPGVLKSFVMSDDETRSRLAEIEAQMEHLRDVVETCRKGMLASRAAIVAGGVLFLINLVGLVASPSLLLALLSFTAVIGGIVWLGANKTSRDETLASLRAAQAEWQAATDGIEMSTVGE